MGKEIEKLTFTSKTWISKHVAISLGHLFCHKVVKYEFVSCCLYTSSAETLNEERRL